MSFRVFDCDSLEWLCVISGVPLLLTWMAAFGFRCHTATDLGGSVSS